MPFLAGAPSVATSPPFKLHLMNCRVAARQSKCHRELDSLTWVATIMSELKFACPVCGQHITCDSGSSGSPMACPTCFRQLVVPQANAPGASSLVLTASEVAPRISSPSGHGNAAGGQARSGNGFPWAAVTLGLLVCTAAAVGFVFRGEIWSAYRQGMRGKTETPASRPKPLAAVAAPPESGTNWTLNLADADIPEAPVAGRINGRSFEVQRTTIRGGTLILWRGPEWPPEAGMAVNFFAKAAEDLAGKTIVIEATRTNAPRLMVRWKEAQGQPITEDFHEGYALHVEFGPITGTQLPGKIYLAAPDEEKSYLAGTFDAEIHKASASAHHP